MTPEPCLTGFSHLALWVDDARHNTNHISLGTLLNATQITIALQGNLLPIDSVDTVQKILASKKCQHNIAHLQPIGAAQLHLVYALTNKG